VDQLAQVFRGVRKDRRMTQAMVAERIASLQSKVSAFEADPGKASVARLFRLLSVVRLELVLRDGTRASRRQRKKPEW
jgi:HTH-type transcriptional regulator/antitoxin HipB